MNSAKQLEMQAQELDVVISDMRIDTMIFLIELRFSCDYEG